MKKEFSTSWNSSTQRRKQRKFRFNAPLHIKNKFLGVHLAKELRAKYNIRSIRVRKGDTVKILRGNFKGKEGKVEKVDISKTKVYLEKIQIAKKEGSSSPYPLQPSNLIITSLDLSDKKRVKKQEEKNGKVSS